MDHLLRLSLPLVEGDYVSVSGRGKIAAQVHVTGVSFGHFPAPEKPISNDCFLRSGH